jgi:hypothetical protein
VAAILSQLGEGSSLSKPPSVKVVPTGPGLPALPKKVVDSIVVGQYVDFAELAPARGRTRALPSSEEGHIVVIRAEDLAGCRKLIPDLATWLQCFCIHATVIAEHEPDPHQPMRQLLRRPVPSTSGRCGWSMIRT